MLASTGDVGQIDAFADRAEAIAPAAEPEDFAHALDRAQAILSYQLHGAQRIWPLRMGLD